VVAQHGARFPPSAAQLAELPGIGRSTAAAVAAFCFGERVAILDGNVKRVLTRVLGIDYDLAVARNERALWDVAQSLLPVGVTAREPGAADTTANDIQAYTQGLMDLGATLCTPRKPACDACPWSGVCAARAQGQPEAYPVKTRKLKRGTRSHALLWLVQADRVWLVQRPAQGVWAGLWTMPELDDEAALDALTAAWPGEGRWMPPFKHVLTHLDWTLQPCVWQLPDGLGARVLADVEAQLPAGRWWTVDQALGAGLPAPIRKLLDAGPPR
jgi:A/G-specific adenine glycosylase